MDNFLLERFQLCSHICGHKVDLVFNYLVLITEFNTCNRFLHYLMIIYRALILHTHTVSMYLHCDGIIFLNKGVLRDNVWFERCQVCSVIGIPTAIISLPLF